MVKLLPLAYLDQNILSRLRVDSPYHETVVWIPEALRDAGLFAVYSETHVAECRASDRPESFVDVLETQKILFLEPAEPSALECKASLGRARELLLAGNDFAADLQQHMARALAPVHFAQGWLDPVSSQTIKQEMLADIDQIWERIERELGVHERSLLLSSWKAWRKSIKELPLENIKRDAEDAIRRLDDRLPENPAQIDQISDKEVVAFLLSQLDEASRDAFAQQYPPNFWRSTETREEGALLGFAFAMFTMGLVRDRRVRTRDRKRREKHFLGQFRDCQHIEHASRCAVFITLDKGAMRLARAVYAYAGVDTAVLCLQRQSTEQMNS